MAEGSAAVVTAVYGPLVRIQLAEGAMVVPFRRRLRWHGSPEDHRLVVGDRVLVHGEPPAVVITDVLARQTKLSRKSPGERRGRVIAANVDQAVVVLAAASPEPNPRFLDRLLVASHHAGIRPIVCVNKIDQGTEGIDTWIGDYQDAGYPILLVSARTSRGVGGLARAVNGHTTLFCGASGVGKSALLNAIHPGYRLREGSISEATGKGRHTTSTAELLPLPGGGFVVDTPGVREFGLWDLAPASLQDCFPEIARHAAACEFADCSHGEESGCEVREAVLTGGVASRRYTSYLKLREELTAAAQ